MTTQRKQGFPIDITHPGQPRRRHRQRGVSTVELLITIVFIALGLCIAARSLSGKIFAASEMTGEHIVALTPLDLASSGATRGDAGGSKAVSGQVQQLTAAVSLPPGIRLSGDRRDPYSPFMPDLSGGTPGGGPPPAVEAAVLVGGGAAVGCAVAGVPALAAIVTSPAAPLTCAGGALIGAGVTGAVILGPPLVHAAADSLGKIGGGIRDLLGGDDDEGNQGGGDSKPAETSSEEKLPQELEDLREQAPKPKAGEPVQEGETVPFRDAKSTGRGVTGDQLTGDHIPSNASNLRRAQEAKWLAEEEKLGRPLTEQERANLRLDTTETNKINNDFPTHVINEQFHRGVSDTYGGRNTEAQIAEDTRDPNGAIARSYQNELEYLSREGKLTHEGLGGYVENYAQVTKHLGIQYDSRVLDVLRSFVSRAH